MDDNKTNQSMDGMRSGDSPAPANPAPSIDGFSVPTSQPQRPITNATPVDSFNEADYATEKQLQDESAQAAQQPANDHPTGSSNKGLKLVLTLFVILFLAASAAAAYFYMQSQEEPAPATNTGNVQLEQQVQSLTYDNKTLKTVNTTLTTQNKSLTVTAQQLKTKCGSSCSSIVIPQ